MLANLVLIGFMGCGKSAVGRRLAHLTSHHLVDIDELIAEREGRSISEIFATEGEEHFRGIEQSILEEYLGAQGIVLSTGGGIILREANRLTVKNIGVVGWLDANPAILFERASRSGKRPLLHTENPRETFFRLLESRRGLYEITADFRVDSSNLNHDETAESFLAEAQTHASRFGG